jgi:hypothetical protein
MAAGDGLQGVGRGGHEAGGWFDDLWMYLWKIGSDYHEKG